VRLGWGLRQGSGVDPRLPDQNEYLSIAKNVLAGRGFVFHDDRFDQDIYAYRTPGYPLFLAAAGGSPLAARVAQALVDTCTVLGVYLLGRRWLRRNWALVPAVFVALNPFLVYFSGLILSETVFASLLIWSLVLLVASTDANSKARRWQLLSGCILLGCSAMVRPSALLLAPLLAFAIGPNSVRQRLAHLALCIAALAALFFPWALRNRLVLGRWILATTNGGISRYDGFHPAASGASDQSFLQCPQFAGVKSMGEVQRDRFFSDLADQRFAALCREHPSQLLRLSVLKLARTWSPIPLSRDFGRRTIYIAAGLVYYAPFYLLIVAGLFGRAIPLSARVLLVLPPIYLSAVHAMSVGSLRYRIPIEPPMAILAGAGAVVIRRGFGRPQAIVTGR